MKVVSSSSAGNSYVLDCGGDILLIELGIGWCETLRGLNFTIRGVTGALVSHSHRDHSRSVYEALAFGIKVYSTPDVAERHKGVTPLDGLSAYKIGGYKVFTLPVHHDVPCYAYVIQHKGMGKLLFATDTMMLDYRVSGLNHIMIEANYSDEEVDGNVSEGNIAPMMRERLMTTHLSIDNVIGMLRANDLSAVNEIVLLHLSNWNADATDFKTRVERATGKLVYVAEKGMEIDVGKEVY